MQIVRDKETGVNYYRTVACVVAKNSRSNATYLCPVRRADGTVLVTDANGVDIREQAANLKQNGELEKIIHAAVAEYFAKLNRERLASL